MRIEDLRRWHWIVIAVIVGLIGGYVYSGLDPVDPGRSVSGEDFRQLIRNGTSRREGTKDFPLVRGIVVYPPEQGVYGKAVHRVHFEQLYSDPADSTKYAYRPAHLMAEVPFERGGAENNSVVDFLVAEQAQNSAISFRYTWARNPAAVYGLAVLGSLVVIGGAWPTLVNALVGVGYGKKSEKKAYDLDRFGKQELPEEEKSPAKKVPGAADHARLAGMVATLENSLGRGHGGGHDAAAGGSPDEAVRKLDGKPLDAAAAPAKPEDPKDFAGEYYPVARSGKHE